MWSIVAIMQAMTITKTALDIANGLQDLFDASQSQVLERLDELHRKVDHVIVQQDLVLNEIRALPLQIQIIVRQELISALNAEMKGHIDRIRKLRHREKILPSSLTEMAILEKELASSCKDLEFVLSRLISYGYVTYQSVFSATAILSSVYLERWKLAESSDKRNAVSAEALAQWTILKQDLLRWVEVEVDRSVPSTIEEVVAEQKRLMKQIDAFPREIYLLEREYPRSEGNPRHRECSWTDFHAVYLIIDGDMEKGFNDREEERYVRSSNKTCIDGPGSIRELSATVEAQEPLLELTYTSILETCLQSALSRDCGKSDHRWNLIKADHDETKKLNGLRQQYLQIVSVEALLKKILFSIDEMLSNLNAQFTGMKA